LVAERIALVLATPPVAHCLTLQQLISWRSSVKEWILGQQDIAPQKEKEEISPSARLLSSQLGVCPLAYCTVDSKDSTVRVCKIRKKTRKDPKLFLL
jgi:hypothetical protein